MSFHADPFDHISWDDIEQMQMAASQVRSAADISSICAVLFEGAEEQMFDDVVRLIDADGCDSLLLMLCKLFEAEKWLVSSQKESTRPALTW